MSSRSLPGTALSNGIKGNKGGWFLAETRQQVFPGQGDQGLCHSQAQGWGNAEGRVTNSGWENCKDDGTQRVLLELGVAE